MRRQISAHFTAAENRCRCGECDRYSADVELVALLEEIRTYFGGASVIVHSWFRCRAHNNRPRTEKSASGHPGAGSSDSSWHIIGGAADFHILGVTNEAIRDFIRSRYPDCYGVGIYDWGLHLDVRPRRGDWDERSAERHYA